MIPLWLVQINRRTGRHIKAGHPHRTDENDTERIVGVFEFGVQILIVHAFTVQKNVHPLLSQIGDFVL